MHSWKLRASSIIPGCSLFNEVTSFLIFCLYTPSFCVDTVFFGIHLNLFQEIGLDLKYWHAVPWEPPKVHSILDDYLRSRPRYDQLVAFIMEIHTKSSKHSPVAFVRHRLQQHTGKSVTNLVGQWNTAAQHILCLHYTNPKPGLSSRDGRGARCSEDPRPIFTLLVTRILKPQDWIFQDHWCGDSFRTFYFWKIAWVYNDPGPG